MEKNKFDRMADMVRDGDKRLMLAPMSNIKNVFIKGMNGSVEFGVPREIAQMLIDDLGKYSGGFLIVPTSALEQPVAAGDTK